MTTIADLIKDFIDTSKERLKTPISGAFLWAFIIWNWRPIFELLFSKIAIEDRIYIIEQEYCKPENIYWPVGIALFYTIIIPVIMIGVDWILAPIKKIRIGRIYQSKDFVTDEKIKLARKEFELKNVESGNKQIEDFQRQIQDLEESKNMLVSHHQLEKDELNKIIKESSIMLKESRERSDQLSGQILHLQSDLEERHKESQIDDRVIVALAKLTPGEAHFLRIMQEKGIDNLNNEESMRFINNLSNFIELDLIKDNDNSLSYSITNFGLQVIERIGNITL